jgi:hypothetical protein
MKNLKMLKDLGYELNILQSIRFNTKIQFDLNGHTDSKNYFNSKILSPVELEELKNI